MTLREFRRLTASMDDDTLLVVTMGPSMLPLTEALLLPPEEERPVPYLLFRLLEPVDDRPPR